LGQNFLLDPDMHRLIADAADLGPADLALEIGVGLGFLTRELAARAGRVLGVEVDRRLLEIVRGELGGFPGGGRHVRLIEADALDGDELHGAVATALEGELATIEGRFAVVCNPPYRIAGPLMALWVGLGRLPDRIVVLVPEALAARWAAGAGSRAYGALSAAIQIAYRPAVLRKVARQAFRPRPRVDSAVLRLQRREDREAPGVEERRGFQRFLRALFGFRRKKLATGVPAACRALNLPETKPDPGLRDLRPEALGPDELLALYRRCASFS
jgi:16S rRNA (adenine1518-N6/adenine1519-N6)-dimethyltransferase